MFTRMLVPLDGSEFSEGILPWVSHIARSLDIPVMLLSIVDPSGPALAHQAATPGVVRYQERLPFLSFAADEQFYTARPAQAARRGLPTSPSRYQYDYADHHPKNEDIEKMSDMEEWLQKCGSTLRAQGVNVLEDAIVGAYDKPSQVILQFAEDNGCDVIAMARHNRNLLEETFKSSVTGEVIQSSRIPVVAMMPEQGSDLSGIPVSLSSLSTLLDGSAFAESVLPYVKNLASRLSLEVVLVRWLSGEQFDVDLIGIGNEPLNTDLLRLQNRREITGEVREAIKYLQGITKDLIAEGLTVGWEIPKLDSGSAEEKIAQGNTENMIVLASHGRSGIFRWLEGNVAEELLKETGGPLLIIPPILAQQYGGV